MTATDLGNAFTSTDFQHDLQEISCYLASIMQERPIIYALAKCLWKRGYKFELEDKRQDLFVDGKRIEFKFNYDRAGIVLEAEMARWSNFEELWAAVEAGESSKSWGVLAKIYEDMHIRKPHIFVWVVCSRDLSKVAPEDQKRICRWREQGKYNAAHPHGSDRKFLSVIDSFLDKMQTLRPFSLLTEEIATSGDFPSIYHFKICEFSKAI